MDPAPGSPRLLTQVRQTIRLHHYSRRTEEAYVGWVRRYVRFSGMRHPAELGAEDVRRFLTALADQGSVSASTQTQALSGLLFLYRQVLGRDLDSVAIVRPGKPVRLPVVLGRHEVRELLGALTGTPRLVAVLLYGSGLRLLEALQLRVKDLDFTTGEVVVRRGKGGNDRITMMADSAHQELTGNSSGFAGSISATWLPAAGMFRFGERFTGSPRARLANGRGSMCFRRPGGTWIRRAASATGITCTNRWSSGRSSEPFRWRG